MVNLKSSSGTGKKIMNNWGLFTFLFLNTGTLNESKFVNFEFTSASQTGTFVIQQDKDGRIKDSSTLNCDDFDRSLGMNNDPSLRQVAEKLLNSHGISYI